MCRTPLDTVYCMVEWIKGLEVLGIFWARRLKNLEIHSANPPVLSLTWRRGRGVIMYCPMAGPECIDALRRAGENASRILITGSALGERAYDRWSKIFIYPVGGSTLEPNRDVTIEVYEPERIRDRVLAEARMVQQESWGFYIPPPAGDYVILAKLPSGRPVGTAYYNPASSNVDFGIHVARTHWRRRIGTRLLLEALRLAESSGRMWLSIVRVIRGKRPTTGDRRAISFYRANNPVAELNVYRITI